jgi:hypothetical protein
MLFLNVYITGMVDTENIAYKRWILPKKSLHALLLAAASQSVRLKE